MSEFMYERLLKLYKDGQLSDKGIDNAAILKGWITPEEADTIKNANTANE